MAEEQPPKRQPPKLLQQIQKKKKKKKPITTTVRTRDGKIYKETINADGSVSKEFKGQEALPSYLSNKGQHITKPLPSYIYSSADKKWVAVQHKAKPADKDDAKQSDTNNNNANDTQEEKKANDEAKQKVCSLTIVSYNIWFADREWEQRQQKLLSMLEEINPDIFCLQEVTPRFLAGFCDHKYIQDHFELTDKKDNLQLSTCNPYGVMIGCNRGKNGLSMQQVNICSLASNMGRKLVQAEIALSGEQKETLWINTVHLESLLNDLVRIEQLKDIFNVYTKQHADTMLMGDFNFGERTHENEHISKEFTDCWLDYKQKLIAQKEKENKKFALRELVGDTCGGARYDRILLRSGKWEVDKFEIIGKVNMPSDHLGVVVKLVAK
eukprot:CAMPEP_0197030826 /NCGR_PEP_ID=MMETSP1384-20130603/9973_1 /TAXON_ID=29189 /ORGANISM="Ammonia sp." /LENGTH=381 /DNA_ID=CAMNT_0042460251 /DNA_START=15 /DNA_END=1160 /DNA_ORIENTATION=-